MDDVLFSSDQLIRWGLILVVVVLGLAPDAPAAALPASSRTAAVSPAALMAGAVSWRSLYAPLESLLGSRRRLVQLSAVGICIALYILMRHR
jgi:hypothetical protein